MHCIPLYVGNVNPIYDTEPLSMLPLLLEPPPLPLSRAVAGDTDLPTRCENICRLDVIKTKSATSINFCGGWGMHSGEPKVWKPYHHL